MTLQTNRRCFGFVSSLIITLMLCFIIALPTYAQVNRNLFNVFQQLKSTGGTGFTVTSSTSGIITPVDDFNNKGNAINSGTTSPSTWSYLASLGGSAWLEVRDNSGSYTAGTYVGFTFSTGGLLEANSTTRIETFLGASSTVVETYTPDNSTLSASVLNSAVAKVGFVTTAAFDRVRITFTTPVGLAGSRSVYYAEVLIPQAGPVPACNTTTSIVQTAYPAIATSGASGITINALDPPFSNIGNVVDGDITNFATMKPSLLGVGDSMYISVREAGNTSHPAQYFAGFEIANPLSIASVGLLSNSIIATYNNGVFQESTSGTNLLLAAPVLSSGGRTTVGFMTTKPFNEIRYISKNLVSADLLSSINVYRAVIKQFCAGDPLVCNTLTRISSTLKPVFIDAANTGSQGVANVCLTCNPPNYENIIDGNANTFATLDFTAGALTAHTVAVKDALNTYPKGTYAGYDIRISTLLDVNVANLITIQLLNNGTVVQTASGGSLLAGVSTDLVGQPSRLPVGIIANVPFDEVKMIINKPVGLNVFGSMDIFDFVLQDNSCIKPLPCNATTVLTSGQNGFDVVIDGNKTGFTGAVSAVDAIINPWNVVTPSLTDFARIQIVGNVLAQGSIAVAAGNSVFPKGVFAGFLVRENNNNPLVLANLLKMIRITTYKRDVNGVPQQVESRTGAQLLGLTALLPLLGNDHGIRTVGFVTTQPFDEIQISAGGLVDVGLPRTLDVFGAAIDTRYLSPEAAAELGCPVFRTNPDINYTIVNVPVTGSVATNDVPASGSTYSGAVPVNGADGQPNPGPATLNLNSNGTYTFTATTPGVYSYNITVTNGTSTEVQNLTITVGDPAVTTNPPVANTDIAVTMQGDPVTVNVLANDHAGNTGGTLGTPSITDQPSNGSAGIAGGQLVYTPNEGFVGKDTIVYQVCETPGGLCKEAYVFVEVKPDGVVNTTSATDDFAVTNSGAPINGNVKTNDIDPEGHTQTITGGTFTNASGTLVLAADGTYTFTPAPGFSGTAKFAYTTSDNGSPSAFAAATLYVYVKASGLNPLPDNNAGFKDVDIPGNVATNDKVPAGSQYGTPVAVDGPDGQPNPTGAAVVFTMNPNGTYTFKSNTPGVYSYNVPVCLPSPDNNTCASELLTITILDPAVNTNDPVVMNDVATTQAGTAATIPVKANDKPGNTGGNLGNPGIVTQPQHGTVSVNNTDGTVIYTPAPGYVGKDKFTYSVLESPSNKSGTAEVTVNVTPLGVLAAIAADDYVTASPGVEVISSVIANDGTGQNVTVIPPTTDSRGTFELRADGNFAFTPAAGFTGTAVYEYTTCISGGDCAKATVYVTVKSALGIPDLTPTTNIASLNFFEGAEGDFVVSLYEILGADALASATTIQFRVQLLSGFDITVPGITLTGTEQPGVSGISNVGEQIQNTNGDWLFRANSSNIFIKAKPTTTIPALGSAKLGFHIKRKAGVPANTSQNITVTVVAGSGNEGNVENNIVVTTVTANN